MFYVFRYDHSTLRMNIGYLNDIWCCLGTLTPCITKKYLEVDKKDLSVKSQNARRFVSMTDAFARCGTATLNSIFLKN